MNWEIGEIPEDWRRGEHLVVVSGSGRMRAVHRHFLGMDGPDSPDRDVFFTFDSYDVLLAKKVSLWIQWFEMSGGARRFDFAVGTMPDGWQQSDVMVFETPVENPLELWIYRVGNPNDCVVVSMTSEMEFRRAHAWLVSLCSAQ